MKKNKIDKSIIMHWPNLGEIKVPAFDEVLKNIKKHPNLFLAGSIRVTDSKNFDSQFKVLEEALVKKQIVGVKLYLGYEHFFANDPRCDAIYELCVRYNAPVIFHTGDTWCLKRAIVRFANPIYIDDVAVKFPKLKILIAHLGNPCWTPEAAEVVSKNKNVYTDFSGILSLSGRFKKVYYESVKRQILELVAYCETPRKLLFGTDFELGKQEDYIEFLESFEEFSKTDMEYIKHKNAEKLFGI
jgi:hypothetical protein